MLVLAVDGSGKGLSLALGKDDEVLGSRFLLGPRAHSQSLMPAMRGLLQDLDLRLDQLDALALSVGPGSYTGIRIALSTMKTLAYALSLPLFSFSSLRAMAAPFQPLQKNLLTAIDARRSRVFAALWQGSRLLLGEANREAAELLRELPREEEIWLLGDGAAALQAAAAQAESTSAAQPLPRLQLLHGNASALRADALIPLAYAAWQRGDRPGWAEAKANYLSASQAARLHPEMQRQAELAAVAAREVKEMPIGEIPRLLPEQS